MIDHQYHLLSAILARLGAAVPLVGGWQIERVEEEPTYPVGYIDLTSSVPSYGQNYYRETHRGVISVYLRHGEPTPLAAAMEHSFAAKAALTQSVPSQFPGFEITKFNCGGMTPRNDGTLRGRAFQFTAITHEVQNG